ncbi:similar to Saccharomyces cerevisiae YMR111C Protein of unknown function [Maudiozyma barnettii]|uniref:Transcription activator GCR1-like domain-containing protein n=1 Tax=Maudiozyma barnettii TaxID=61262 RepID=A0A8H2ZHZ6_9SACH|nr:Euc1p [Kazachstania barnettii]CAB4254448.1 similar to Saccharomyces cerevisiae YMR111C Protein of unknown function [Kazachstania barnettii]CAD1782407.1 similar to Saccharomyces cerevisiae YMR111C Protein of unknown function [Kazachstania barnettii]
MDSDDSDYPLGYGGYRSESIPRDTSGATQPNPNTTNNIIQARNATQDDGSNVRASGPSAEGNIVSTNTTISTNVTATGVGSNLTSREFQTFIIDQMMKIQEQNETLRHKVETLEQEQEAYYLNNAKRLESGFKDIKKSVTEVSQLKKLFKEVVGIMSGERLRFLDHSDENAVDPITRTLGQEDTDYYGSGQGRTEVDYAREAHDRSILLNSDRIVVKRETDGDDGNLPLLSDQIIRNTYTATSTIPDRLNVRLPGHQHPGVISRAQVLEDEHARDSLIAAQEEGDREMENAIRTDLWKNYKMNIAIQSVYDVAKEYYEGFPGKPSLLQLERKFGSTWRRQRGQRVLFAKRKCLISRIENIIKNPKQYNLPEGIKRNQAIKVLENIRLGNNSYKGNICLMSISQLYEYLSRKDDKVEDYSLNIKQRGIPRRLILQRQREDTIMRNIQESQSASSETPGETLTGEYEQNQEHEPDELEPGQNVSENNSTNFDNIT